MHLIGLFSQPGGRQRAMLLATGLLLGLLLYALTGGLNTTSDSAFYLSAAHSFGQNMRLLNPDGTPYHSWGPLYPVLLSVAGAWLPGWIAVLHIGSLLGSLWLWGWLAGRMLSAPALAAIGTLALGLSAPWLITAKFVWSEPVFILLFAAYAAALCRYLETAQAKWLWIATGVGILLPLQRSSGLFLLLGSALGVVAAYGPLVRRDPWAWGGHFSACFGAAVSWQWYASTVAPQPEVYRSRGWAGLLETLSDYGYVLLRWLVPVQQGGWPKHVAFAGLLILLLMALGYAAWRSGRVGRWLGLVGLVYLVCHIGTTVMSRSGGNVYDVERYTAVLYGPFLLLLCGAVQGVAGGRRWGAVLLGLWLLYPAARAVRVAHFCHRMEVRPWPWRPALAATNPPSTAPPAADRGSRPAAPAR